MTNTWAENFRKRTRAKAFAILGSKCQECGTEKKLQLHHKYYAPDSIYPKTHNESGWTGSLRAKEAIAHPERFMVVCLSCHNSIQPRRKWR